MATIKAIEGRSVHQIQSGQVIVDLNSVVKELVENSLDAGATSIDVRFKNSGLDAIEVQDNGKGLSPDDFETVALKHYTSKLSNYEDLTTLDTFGFRGEALSSLCALSSFQILTARTQDGPLGRKLEFETSGKLKSNTPASAQKGTTVYVEGVFHNLPVRRKELEKNIKREYQKVVHLLYAYACISVGVRFSVSTQPPKGKKVTVFSTKSNTTTKENIANVFGAKMLLALTKLDLKLQMAPSAGPTTQGARNWSTQATDRSLQVQVQGHISRPIFGEGRQAPDRQMFFVNSRPCLLPQVSKAINEVYKSFNVSQSPFIFANLVMDTNAYDVNVSPDKRTIMLHDQTALLESLKSALTELFESTDHTVPQSTLPNKKLPSYKPLSILRNEPIQSNTTAASEEDGSTEESEDDANERPAAPPSNLIADWVGRDAEPKSKQSEAKLLKEGLSKEKQKLVESLKKKNDTSNPVTNSKALPEENPVTDDRNRFVDQQPGAIIAPQEKVTEKDLPHLPGALEQKHTDSSQNLGPLSSPYNDLFSQRPPAPPAVQHSPAESVYSTSGEDEEPSISAITPGSQKAAPGPIQNAFDKMRPKRTPLQVAEITIGNVTTTTLIGNSPPYKKRRIHKPHNSQAAAKYGASPSLALGLRKNFAAPGSRLEFESSQMLPSAPRTVSVKEESSDDEPDSVIGPERPSATPTFLPPTTSIPGDSPASDTLEDFILGSGNDDGSDEEYADEEEKKIREEKVVADLIREAEQSAARPTEENLKRATAVFRNGGNRKDSTLRLVRYMSTDLGDVRQQLSRLVASSSPCQGNLDEPSELVKDQLDDSEAESRLSLTVTKSDFERMRVVGQFNLGFILAVRPGATTDDEEDLFIIDQHAADEKYNYELLQRTVTLQSQRLVLPKEFEITAMQEEVVLNHTDALKANGFEVESLSSFNPSHLDDENGQTNGRRCLRILTLPTSKEKTFDLDDLEELLYLLSEQPAGSIEIPRPKKVQTMLAMRACRSSIMVGKTLTMKQMEKVVRHMSEMEKPWNCPHGRPTMRHLAGLKQWRAWQEGDIINEEEKGHGQAQDGGRTDWARWLEARA